MGGGGGSLFSSIGSLFSAIGPILTIAIEALKAIAGAIEAIGKELGILEKDEEIDDIGDRALQSDLQPADFENQEDYINHLRTVELDPEKSESFTEQEKLAAGSLVVEAGIEEETGNKMGDFFMNVASKNPDYYSSEKLNNYITTFSEAGVDLDRISDLESGKIGEVEDKKEINALIEKADLL